MLGNLVGTKDSKDGNNVHAVTGWRIPPVGNLIRITVSSWPDLAAMQAGASTITGGLVMSRGTLTPQNNDFTSVLNDEFKDGLEEMIVVTPSSGYNINRFYGFEFVPRIPLIK
jgi:hypothetical protein